MADRTAQRVSSERFAAIESSDGPTVPAGLYVITPEAVAAAG